VGGLYRRPFHRFETGIHGKDPWGVSLMRHSIDMTTTEGHRR
jgi:hypothetical protein